MSKRSERPRMPVVLGVSSGMMRDSITTFLSDSKELEVVGEARSIEEIVETLNTDRVQIVLLGSTLADQVLLTVETFTGKSSRVVMVVQNYRVVADIARFITIGCKGVVSTDIKMTDLVRALHLVAGGLTVYPDLTTPVVPPGIRSITPAGNVHLSPRERAILELLAQGSTEKEMSHTLGLGQRTLQTYLDRVRRKLAARNRVQAVAIAVAMGHVSPNK